MQQSIHKKFYKGRPDENKINPHEMYIYFALVKKCNADGQIILLRQFHLFYHLEDVKSSVS